MCEPQSCNDPARGKPVIFSVADKPCSTCPYRRDTPPGIWDASEYQKLPEYDERPGHTPVLAPFMCHSAPQSSNGSTLCRGWLSVHKHSVAVRLLIMLARIDPDKVYARPKVKLYKSGQEACDAGMAGVDEPGIPAREAAQKLRKLRRANQAPKRRERERAAK